MLKLAFLNYSKCTEFNSIAVQLSSSVYLSKRTRDTALVRLRAVEFTVALASLI